MMYNDGDSRPYYYVLDRMFNIRALIDRAGAIVERICYDDYGRPLIRESCGRGDLNQDSKMNGTDDTRFALAKNTCSSSCIWDPRADLDDDGDVDSADQSLYDTKRTTWNVTTCDGTGPTVAQAFSDVDNPYLFQGVPHFALDTAANDTSGKLMLNHHRARFADPVAGQWVSRDPIDYYSRFEYIHYLASFLWPLSAACDHGHCASNLFEFENTNPVRVTDPTGMLPDAICSPLFSACTHNAENNKTACFYDCDNQFPPLIGQAKEDCHNRCRSTYRGEIAGCCALYFLCLAI